MDKLHTTMVNACDRLLLLLTGPEAVTDPAAAEAALEAIEILRVLEGHLKGAAGNAVIDEGMFDRIRRRSEVSNHISEVVGILRDEGFCRTSVPRRLHA
jgi:hypothetical protein